MPNADHVILLGVDGATAASATNPVPVKTEASGGTSDVNIADVAGTATAAGNGTTTAGTLRVTVSSDSTGSLTNPSIGADGSAVKTSSTLMGVSDGTNQQQIVAPIALGDGVNGNNTASVANFVYNGTTYDRARGNTSGNYVQGPGASAASPVGNPIRTAGVVNTSSGSSATTGQTSDLWLGTGGSTIVAGISAAGADGSTNTLGFLPVVSSVSARNFSVAPSLFNGSTWDRQRSGGVLGMAGVSLQATPSGAASYAHVAAGQATTVIKASAGTLYAVVFNSVATSTNVTTIYDNASGAGTVIAIPQATLATGLQPLTFGAAGLAFSNGCTVITTTANGADMTFVYK